MNLLETTKKEWEKRAEGINELSCKTWSSTIQKGISLSLRWTYKQNIILWGWRDLPPALVSSGCIDYIRFCGPAYKTYKPHHLHVVGHPRVRHLSSVTGFGVGRGVCLSSLIEVVFFYYIKPWWVIWCIYFIFLFLTSSFYLGSERHSMKKNIY